MWNKRARGVTLVELVVAIVIIGVALGGVLAVFTQASIASTDPLIRKQMTAIAEGMMEEIQRMPYGPQNQPPKTCARETFTTLMDYNGYDCGEASDVLGTPIPGLTGYRVKVSVSTAQPTSPMYITDKPANSALISVEVKNGNQTFKLLGWRSNFGAAQTAPAP